MHGIFPTHNKYYLHHEIFPYLSKKEIRDVYYPPKTKKEQSNNSRSFKKKTEDGDE